MGSHLVRLAQLLDVALDRLDGLLQHLGLRLRAEGHDREADGTSWVHRLGEPGGELLGGDGVEVVLVAPVGEDDDVVGDALPVPVATREVRGEDRVVEAGAGAAGQPWR